MFNQKLDLRVLLLSLAALTIWRVLAAQHAQPELFFDEAQYWDWAQTLAWGYYSKPPMLAWMIALTTGLLGDSEPALRAAAMILYPSGAVLLFFATRRLLAWQPDALPASAPFWVAITYATLPLVSLGSWLITTDAALLFFWAGALLFFIRAVEADRWRDWLVLGLCVGLGMLSKYTMGFFPLAALGYLLFHRRDLLRSFKPWVAALLAGLILLPNMLWNAQHDFASLHHTADISQLDRSLFHPQAWLSFFAAQFAVFGPLLFAALLWLVFGTASRSRQRAPQPAFALLAWFALLPLAAFMGLALLSRAFANWAAFAYIAATPLAVLWLLAAAHRRWLMAALVVNLGIAAVIYHYHDIARAAGIELTRKTDPYSRISGWRALGSEVSTLLSQHPQARLLATDRQVITELLYYSRPRSRPAFFWNLSGRIDSHYALKNDIQQAPQGEFLLIGGPTDTALLARHFKQTERLPDIVIPLYPDLVRRYSVSLVMDYRP